MESSSLEISLDRFDRVYRPGDTIKGTLDVLAYKGWTHNGIQLWADGTVFTLLQGTMMSLSGDQTKEEKLFSYNEELIPPGKAPEGRSRVSFEIKLPKDGPWQESYHGCYVSVIYSIGTSCDRGMMKKALKREIEFIMEIPAVKPLEPKPVTFDISPQSLSDVPQNIMKTLPDFRVTGKLHRSNCNINHPFTGEVNINMSVAAIRSVELQLARIESVFVPASNKFQQEASEVMRIQIGEGNLCRDMVVPIYMVFPRLHSCPTLKTKKFKIEFEMNMMVIFDDGHFITENFPIFIQRD